MPHLGASVVKAPYAPRQRLARLLPSAAANPQAVIALVERNVDDMNLPPEFTIDSIELQVRL